MLRSLKAHHQNLTPAWREETPVSRDRLVLPVLRVVRCEGEVKGSRCSPCTHVFFTSLRKTTFKNRGCWNWRDRCPFHLDGAGFSSHFKHRCSSSSPGDMLGPVNTAKQANGIYFCQCHVQTNKLAAYCHMQCLFDWKGTALAAERRKKSQERKEWKNSAQARCQAAGEERITLRIQKEPWTFVDVPQPPVDSRLMDITTY